MADIYPPQVPGVFEGFLNWKTYLDKTANYTLKVTDNGSFCTNLGAIAAVTFTLPAIAQNYRFGFFVAAEQTLTITSPEGTNIVAPTLLTATSLAFSTGGQRIGAFIELRTNQSKTKWYALKGGFGALTVS